jgi:hypothetical protein
VRAVAGAAPALTVRSIGLAGIAPPVWLSVPFAAGRTNGATHGDGSAAMPARSSWMSRDDALTVSMALLAAPGCMVRLRKVSLRNTVRLPFSTLTSVTMRLKYSSALVVS